MQMIDRTMMIIFFILCVLNTKTPIWGVVFSLLNFELLYALVNQEAKQSDDNQVVYVLTTQKSVWVAQFKIEFKLVHFLFF